MRFLKEISTCSKTLLYYYIGDIILKIREQILLQNVIIIMFSVFIIVVQSKVDRVMPHDYCMALDCFEQVQILFPLFQCKLRKACNLCVVGST